MYFVLWSITVFVMNGNRLSPEKAAIQVDKNVYMETAHHFGHVSKTTPNRELSLFGPKRKNVDLSAIMMTTNTMHDTPVHVPKKSTNKRLSSNIF